MKPGRARLFVLALLTTANLLPTAGATAEDSAPFETTLHEIPGLIHQVWPMKVSRCGRPAGDLLVLHTVGGPPEPEKWITWLPCGAALDPDDPRIVRRRLDPAAVVVDVASMPGRTGPQLFVASAAGLRIESLDGSQPARSIKVPGGLPLPHRPWEISRVQIVDDWEDMGPPKALLPAPTGAWLVDLDSGDTRLLPMPIYAEYRTWDPHLPETEWQWVMSRTRWPSLSRADDNGDGRLDLFALSRWSVFIYHAGPEGLPASPSRRLALTPFDEETEREHESTATHYFARDIDLDTRADLILNTVGGGLSDGRTTSRIYLNRGTGVDPTQAPDAESVLEGGLSTITFVDVDGDGRDEILEMSLEFGVLQVVRFLLTRTAQMRVRILALDPESKGGTRALFEDAFTFRFDFDEGTIGGILPSLGDWNGDGLQDFHLRASDDEITFRMGSARPGDDLFGRKVGRQPVPLDAGRTRTIDLDGDGLDDLVAFDPKKVDAPLVVLGNRGRLPGTRPSMGERKTP